MKLGLVRFLNARPLDYGFRQAALRGEVEIVEDTPARLYEELCAGGLDAALISSVEVLRHPELFGSCRSVGVCASERVDSIVYLRAAGFAQQPPRLVLADSGSRSSVALLEILLRRTFPEAQIEWRAADPSSIPDLVDEDTAGLLIGDSALALRTSGGRSGFVLRDLAEWWFSLEGLPFVFALWAYPRARPLADAFFEESLESGLGHLSEMARASHYPDAYAYLANVLHYRINDRDREALRRFHSLLSAAAVP